MPKASPLILPLANTGCSPLLVHRRGGWYQSADKSKVGYTNAIAQKVMSKRYKNLATGCRLLFARIKEKTISYLALLF
jgi:hypothetical protein